jgi:hypothetical protein
VTEIRFPKPIKMTTEEQQEQRANRAPNPFKPVYSKPKAEPPEKERLRQSGSTLHAISAKKLLELQAGGRPVNTTFRPKPGQVRFRRPRQTGGGHQVRVLNQRTGLRIGRQPLRKASDSANERRKQLKALKVELIGIWGQRCIGSFLGPCQGRLELVHIRSQGAHPDLRLDKANAVLGCGWHHRLGQPNFQFTPELTKALWAAGAILMAAADGQRPDPAWEELQAEIWRVYQQELMERGRASRE